MKTKTPNQSHPVALPLNSVQLLKVRTSVKAGLLAAGTGDGGGGGTGDGTGDGGGTRDGGRLA